MRRRRDNGWESTPETKTERPMGLSGSEEEAPPDDPTWQEGDILSAQLKSGQSLPVGMLAGVVAAAVGAGAWIVVTWQTGGFFAPMALAVGYLVGFAVRWAGQGRTPGFGIGAAVITAAASVAATIVSVGILIAGREGIPLGEAMESLDMERVMEVMGSLVSPLTIVILLFALYESYRVAIVAPPPTVLPEGEHDKEMRQGREQSRETDREF